MGFATTKLFVAFACTVVVATSAESSSSDLDAKVELLSSKIERMEEENLELRKRVADLGRESSSNEAFDCYLTESWSSNGTITFQGCSGRKFNTLNFKMLFSLC